MKIIERIHSWEDADQALAELAAFRRNIAAYTAARDEDIQKAKSRYASLATPVYEHIERLEDELHRFLLSHQEDLDGRSRKLNHGRVGFLLVKHLTVRNVKKAIDWLRETKKVQYLRVTYRLNKEALREAPDEVLRACGARVKPRDEAWYEVDGQRFAIKD